MPFVTPRFAHASKWTNDGGKQNDNENSNDNDFNDKPETKTRQRSHMSARLSNPMKSPAGRVVRSSWKAKPLVFPAADSGG